MRDLIASLIEASGPERLTRTPHTCPIGWEQIKVRKGGKIFYSCKRDATSMALSGANPRMLSWEAVQSYDLDTAAKMLGFGTFAGKDRKIRDDVWAILNNEGDESLKQGKKWLIKTLKPLYKKLGVDVDARRKR